MINLIQFIQEKLVFNKHTKAKSSNILDDLQKYGISVMSEDDINKFNHFHTIKYSIDKNYLFKLRKWHKNIYDDPHKYGDSEIIKYLQDNIDKNLYNIFVGTTFASMYTIKIKFNTSKYDIIQIKLPSSSLKRFIVEIYNENKIEERKNFVLHTIKYILENLK